MTGLPFSSSDACSDQRRDPTAAVATNDLAQHIKARKSTRMTFTTFRPFASG